MPWMWSICASILSEWVSEGERLRLLPQQIVHECNVWGGISLSLSPSLARAVSVSFLPCLLELAFFCFCSRVIHSLFIFLTHTTHSLSYSICLVRNSFVLLAVRWRTESCRAVLYCIWIPFDHPSWFLLICLLYECSSRMWQTMPLRFNLPVHERACGSSLWCSTWTLSLINRLSIAFI